MIEVDNLTKYYGAFRAVDNISFDVAEGEVVGLLGPNGAGKTTLIRMLTCFMPATSGRATVNGYDIFTQGLQVRQSIGYMPENVPLYDDMRVEEYLDFRGRLKELDGGARRKRIDEVLDRTQITDRRRQLIGTLSKGYRQRVGLADSLISDPKILILDEPTIGLDPGQIREARELVQGLAERHTVLLSSHILHEVQQTCSRVIIIAQGRIVANGRVDDLRREIGGGGRTLLEGRGKEPEEMRRALAGLRGVRSVTVQNTPDGFHLFSITAEQGLDVREAVAELAMRRSWSIRELHAERTTLEEFFMQKTSEQNLNRAASSR